jgi:DNA mismatch repair ATPase MutS
VYPLLIGDICSICFRSVTAAELYEKDAEISHRLLDIKLADPGAMGMLTAGVFENAFDPYAAKLIALGYKVVRVEQMQANTKSSEKKNRPKDQACPFLRSRAD